MGNFHKAFIFIILLISSCLNGQIGGDNVYEFMNLSPSARITALGGYNQTVPDEDPNNGIQNPALYTPLSHGNLSISTAWYFGGSNLSNIAYVHNFDSLFTIGVDLHYMDYGRFAGTNDVGQDQGSFLAREYLFNVGISRQQNLLSYGINLKAIQSSLESYSSFGLAADVGANYYNPESQLGLSLVFENIGTQLSTYNSEENLILPFDIQVGISKRLKYVPFRLSIHAHDLLKWDIRYDDPAQAENNSFIGQDTIEKNYFADKLFRHLVFGGEFYFGENVRVRFGYDHQRRQELKLQDAAGMAGISFGAGIRIKRFVIDYGRGNYHFASGTNHFTVSMNLDGMKLPKFGSKKEKPKKKEKKEKKKDKTG